MNDSNPSSPIARPRRPAWQALRRVQSGDVAGARQMLEAAEVNRGRRGCELLEPRWNLGLLDAAPDDR
jgi:hypothetical protein